MVTDRSRRPGISAPRPARRSRSSSATASCRSRARSRHGCCASLERSPVSRWNSSAQPFNPACSVLSRRMRLKSDIWIAAYLRRCQVEGSPAVLRRRGAEEAGAIFVKVSRLDGTADLYGPAPQAVFDEARPSERAFSPALEGLALPEIG